MFGQIMNAGIMLCAIGLLALFIYPILKKNWSEKTTENVMDKIQEIPKPNPKKLIKPAIALIIIALIYFALTDAYAIVQPGHRGILLTWGKVEPVNLPEGLTWKLPHIQKVVNMPVKLQVIDVKEHTASQDLQQVMTELAVHYRIIPKEAYKVYQDMRLDYELLLLKPLIQEDLKATTATFKSEELINTRPLVVLQLEEKITESLKGFGIQLVTVNIVDFQFTKDYWDSVERKAVATQDALTERNKMEIERYKQEQNIIAQQGQYNVTLIRAEAEKQEKIRQAEGEAQRLLLESTAQADAIRIITEQMTPEYERYLWLLQWDGELPDTLLSNAEDLGIILNNTQ